MGSTVVHNCENMNFNITHVSAKDYLLIEVTGGANINLLKGLVRQVLDDPAWHETIPSLVDLRGMSASSLSSDDIFELADLFKSINTTLGSGNTALVVSQELEFGLARMWQMMTEEYVQMEIDVFKNIDEAQKWLVQ